MKILIVEDELHAAQLLRKMLGNLLPEAQVLSVIDSIEDTVDWWKTHPAPDLCFMDIQLADGLSFEIFHQVKVTCPVIFSTAFDQYAVEAFRMNGLDYLLKPIVENDLAEAIRRFHRQKTDLIQEQVMEMVQKLDQRNQRYRERFLVKMGPQLKFVSVREVAWFQADSGYVNLGMKNGPKLILDKSLDQLILELDPELFFQVSRKLIVSVESVSKIFTHLNSRLKLALNPDLGEDAIVSRDRVKGFKEWLDQ